MEDNFPYVLMMVENSTRACLENVLKHRCYEKKLISKPHKTPKSKPHKELDDGHSLFFDGAYKRRIDKAATSLVILEPFGGMLFEKGFLLKYIHSNNEAEYATSALGLTLCIELGVKRLNVSGDAMLLIRHIQSTWACKSSGLALYLKKVRELMKSFEDIQVHHIPRENNKTTDALAGE